MSLGYHIQWDHITETLKKTWMIFLFSLWIISVSLHAFKNQPEKRNDKKSPTAASKNIYQQFTQTN